MAFGKLWKGLIHPTQNDGDKYIRPIILTHRKVLKTSHTAYAMLLVQGRISQKDVAFYVPKARKVLW